MENRVSMARDVDLGGQRFKNTETPILINEWLNMGFRHPDKA